MLFFAEKLNIRSQCINIENFNYNVSNYPWGVWDGNATIILNNSLTIIPRFHSNWINTYFYPPLDVSNYSYFLIKESGIDMVRYRITNLSNDTKVAGNFIIHKYYDISINDTVIKVPIEKKYGVYIYHLGFHVSYFPAKIQYILLCR